VLFKRFANFSSRSMTFLCFFQTLVISLRSRTAQRQSILRSPSPLMPADVPSFPRPPWQMAIRPRLYSQCSGSIVLHISVSCPPIHLPTKYNTYKLGFVTGKKKQIIPWGTLVKDPSSWISDECVPHGFEWKDPSKIQIGEVFCLLYHWRDRQAQDLNPLVWVPTCLLFQDAEKPSRHLQNVRRIRAEPQQESDEEVFNLPSSRDIEEDEDDYSGDTESSDDSSKDSESFNLGKDTPQAHRTHQDRGRSCECASILLLCINLMNHTT
jgi:hypothetical protein